MFQSATQIPGFPKAVMRPLVPVMVEFQSATQIPGFPKVNSDRVVACER
jgi:hypothetical protein